MFHTVKKYIFNPAIILNFLVSFDNIKLIDMEFIEFENSIKC